MGVISTGPRVDGNGDGRIVVVVKLVWPTSGGVGREAEAGWLTGLLVVDTEVIAVTSKDAAVWCTGSVVLAGRGDRVVTGEAEVVVS